MKRQLEGYLDHTQDGLIFGWARNINAPQERLPVTITLSNGWSKTTIADEQREDLALQGIGDSRYGFRTRIPYKIASSENITVSAKVTDEEYILENSNRKLLAEYPIKLIAGDITNNCNLRCPFCITDYSLTKGLKRMPEEVFDKAIDLLYLLPDGMFWLSCMHEATIHPKFIEFIERVPRPLRKKISLTTNFCKRLDTETIRKLSESCIHSIRISIDSMHHARFSELRKGGNLDVFLENLSKLSPLIRNNAHPPELRFISMVFANNIGDIPSVIQYCKEAIPNNQHEIRFVFYQPHIAEWGQNNIVSISEWERLKDLIRTTPENDNVEFFDPFPDTHQAFSEKRDLQSYQASPAIFGGLSTPTNYSPADPLLNKQPIPDEALRLRLRWDGLMVHEKMPETAFLRYVQDLSPEYFSDLRSAAQPSNLDGWEKSTNPTSPTV